MKYTLKQTANVSVAKKCLNSNTAVCVYITDEHYVIVDFVQVQQSRSTLVIEAAPEFLNLLP